MICNLSFPFDVATNQNFYLLDTRLCSSVGKKIQVIDQPLAS